MLHALLVVLAPVSGPLVQAAPIPGESEAQPATTTEVAFTTHDGLQMHGKLTLPAGPGPHPLVVYVQTAEGMTVDMRRPLGAGVTFDYFDLYREYLPALGCGFFSYEGRGITMGELPPRFESVERDVFDSSSLDSKVRDALSALAAVRGHERVDARRILLMGASEGTLIAADAAARAPEQVAGLVLYGVMSRNLREVFRYILTDGAFLTYRSFLDTDADGAISRAEFEADERGYVEAVFRGVGFALFDRDRDGRITTADLTLMSKLYLDAIDDEDYAVLDWWGATSAGVSLPAGWFKDHFEYASIWSFLAQFDGPVGCFHGEDDGAAPVAGVRSLEQQAEASGKTHMEFHYFPGLEHTLGITAYFARGELPAGHQAIFAFIEQTIRER